MNIKIHPITFIVFTFGCLTFALDDFKNDHPGEDPRIQFKSNINVDTGDLISPHIVNGSESKPHAFPFLASLKIYRLTEYRFCGGALISPQWILTAAHCLHQSDFVLATVGGHDIRIPESTQQSVIGSDQILHPGWDPKTASNDIALLKLNSNVNLNEFVKTIILQPWTEKNYSYWRYNVQIAGWGTLKEGVAPSRLNYMNSTVITNVWCNYLYGFGTIGGNQICTDGSNNKSPCEGDSGGPLITTDSGNATVIGVISNISRCAYEKSYPTVATRLGDYLKWISETTGIPLKE